MIKLLVILFVIKLVAQINIFEYKILSQIKKLDPEIMNELKTIEEQEQKVDRNKTLYKGYKEIHNFTKCKTFGDAFKSYIITMDIANNKQHQRREMVYNAFESKAFSLLSTKSEKLSKSEKSSQSEQLRKYCQYISSMYKGISLSILTPKFNTDKIQNKYYICEFKK